MGLAVVAHTLWQHMNFDPTNPLYPNRDRFVLSNGHACVLQYIMLHLTGYDLKMEDLMQFRQLGSKTPGHPENHSAAGIEVTTGPLGQGFANGVGLAIAQKNMQATYGDLFSNMTYVICGDGCLQEGVCCEAASLAGHLQLDNMVVIYDDNKIQIDGDTQLTFTEDVDERFRALGWNVQSIENGYNVEAMEEIGNCIKKAKSEVGKGKPQFIRIRTTIGFGSANQGLEKTHGAPLAKDDIIELKKKWGFDHNKSFVVDDDVRDFFNQYKINGKKLSEEWNEKYNKFVVSKSPLANELKDRMDGKLNQKIMDAFPKFDLNTPLATRKTSEMVINALAPIIPNIIGGSADLTGSNLTRWKDAVDFQPPSTTFGEYKGRYLRFGVREHAMAAICNGISAYKPPRHQADQNHIVPAK